MSQVPERGLGRKSWGNSRIRPWDLKHNFPIFVRSNLLWSHEGIWKSLWRLFYVWVVLWSEFLVRGTWSKWVESRGATTLKRKYWTQNEQKRLSILIIMEQITTDQRTNSKYSQFHGIFVFNYPEVRCGKMVKPQIAVFLLIKFSV